jgi:phosphorylcholine metabolism protein LicD
MDESGLQYTLGAGTLLGAMRNEPPGLLQWEHDVDVYVLARQASQLLRKLQARRTP